MCGRNSARRSVFFVSVAQGMITKSIKIMSKWKQNGSKILPKGVSGGPGKPNSFVVRIRAGMAICSAYLEGSRGNIGNDILGISYIGCLPMGVISGMPQ